MFLDIYLVIASAILGVVGTLWYLIHKEIQAGPEKRGAKELIKDIPTGYTPLIMLAFNGQTDKVYIATILSEETLTFALREVLDARETRLKKENIT